MSPTRLDIAKPDVIRALDERPQRVYAAPELSRILQENRAFWRAAISTSASKFIQFLMAKTHLRKVTLTSEHGYRPLTRYIWRTASAMQVALSLRAGQYLSHAAAAHVLGLTQQPQRTIFVNREQSVKPRPTSPPTSESIRIAFSRPARYSQLSYKYEDELIVLISGKYSGNLGVTTLAHGGDMVPVTGLERTLIDLAVRPEYAGGPAAVLSAFERARDHASISKLLTMLRQLDYAYPFHQAIGFYLDRAGFPPSRLARVKHLGLSVDFYLSHNITRPIYVKEWRLFVPEGL